MKKQDICDLGAIVGSIGFLIPSIWMAFGAEQAQISGHPMLIRKALYAASGDGSMLIRPAEYMTSGAAHRLAIVFLLLSIFGFITSVLTDVRII